MAREGGERQGTEAFSRCTYFSIAKSDQGAKRNEQKSSVGSDRPDNEPGGPFLGRIYRG